MKKLLLLLLLFPGLVSAYTEISDTQIEVNVTYSEPTLNEDNSNLTDLSYTSIYYNGIKVMDVPASSPTGGGGINVFVTIDAPKGQVTQGNFHALAVDENGNASVISNVFVLPIDRASPAPPINLQVQ